MNHQKCFGTGSCTILPSSVAAPAGRKRLNCSFFAPETSHPPGQTAFAFYHKVLYDAVVKAKYGLPLAFCCVALVMTAACSQSNNLLFGRVQATVGTHTVVVTDCYRTSVPSPEKSGDEYRFTPCRDADVVIHGETLYVNGRSYGQLNPGDSILVDHGVVSVNRQQARDGAGK
jgi:hypothetical protein